MRTFLMALLVAALCACAHAQGTVNFINLLPNLANPLVNAPVYESDGVTLLSGPQFMAELLGGPSANNLASIAATGFLTGAGAGYFNGGLQFINSVTAGQAAFVEVRVWNSASGGSFLQARASGLPNSWWQSPIFSVVTGNVPTGAGPTPPAPLTGLGTSPVYLNGVPEPSVLALVGLGMVAVGVGVSTRVRTG